MIVMLSRNVTTSGINVGLHFLNTLNNIVSCRIGQPTITPKFFSSNSGGTPNRQMSNGLIILCDYKS